MTLDDKKNAVKIVTQVITTLSVSHVVHDIIDENTDPESRTDQVRNRIGSFALGGLVAEQAWLRLEGKIDKGFALYTKFFGPDQETETTESE